MNLDHRAQMVAVLCDIDVIIVTGIVFSPPGLGVAKAEILAM
jgi:hypothetical protein